MYARGTLSAGGTYRVWLLEYTGNLREMASGRAEDGRLTAARIEDASASAALKRLQYAEKAGQVVEVALIEPALRDWAGQARGAVLAAGERIREALVSRYNLADLDDDVIDDPLRAALRDIAVYPRGIRGDAGEGGEGMGAAGPDIDG